MNQTIRHTKLFLHFWSNDYSMKADIMPVNGFAIMCFLQGLLSNEPIESHWQVQGLLNVLVNRNHIILLTHDGYCLLFLLNAKEKKHILQQQSKHYSWEHFWYCQYILKCSRVLEKAFFPRPTYDLSKER